jgi:hypothetical protein
LGGLSAQGEWSLGAAAIINLEIDFDDDPVMVGMSDETMACCCAGQNQGSLNLNYSNDGLNIGLEFSTDSIIHATMMFWGDRYAFNAEADLLNLLGGFVTNHAIDRAVVSKWGGGFEQLWGYYKFLDEMLHLEVALAGRWNPWWISDIAVQDLFNNDDFGGFAGIEDLANFEGWNSGIIVNLSFAGLDFGAFIPGLMAPWGPLELIGEDGNWGPLGLMVVGLKFNMDPVEFAAIFSMENYGAYFGAKWALGSSLTAGLSFYGEFDEEAEAAVAISFTYDGGNFGASVKGGYYLDTSDEDAWFLKVAPSFWYNVIADHMHFALDAEFGFGAEDFIWEFFPKLFWNFKGTGAGGSWGPSWDTGIGIGYQIKSDEINRALFTFRWSM